MVNQSRKTTIGGKTVGQHVKDNLPIAVLLTAFFGVAGYFASALHDDAIKSQEAQAKAFTLSQEMQAKAFTKSQEQQAEAFDEKLKLQQQWYEQQLKIRDAALQGQLSGIMDQADRTQRDAQDLRLEVVKVQTQLAGMTSLLQEVRDDIKTKRIP